MEQKPLTLEEAIDIPKGSIIYAISEKIDPTKSMPLILRGKDVYVSLRNSVREEDLDRKVREFVTDVKIYTKSKDPVGIQKIGPHKGEPEYMSADGFDYINFSKTSGGA